MAPRVRLIRCEICSTNEFKYTCSGCKLLYCSLPCYKKHKESCQPDTAAGSAKEFPIIITEPLPPEVKEDAMEQPRPVNSSIEEPLEEPKPLRPLTSLKWPYVPDQSAYPDPLKRDDPKILQLHQYEAIATSPAIRNILSCHANLPALLTSIDKLRGPDREQALQRALGVSAADVRDRSNAELGEDVLALRELAGAIEAAVRGGDQTALGLDWGD